MPTLKPGERIQDSSKWEVRYPNLAKYLDIVRTMIDMVMAVEVISILLLGLAVFVKAEEGWKLIGFAVWIVGGIFVWFQYVMSKASLECVFAFLSMEQETVESRKMLRLLTAGSDRAGEIADTPELNVESPVAVEETASALGVPKQDGTHSRQNTGIVTAGGWTDGQIGLIVALVICFVVVSLFISSAYVDR
jgi:hypothetical protein